MAGGSTESSPADPEPTVTGGWSTGGDQVQKAQKPPKTRNATAERARLPVTAKRYRKPKKIPQFFPRAAGSGGLKMRMGNHPLQVGCSHWEATGTKCLGRSRPQGPHRHRSPAEPRAKNREKALPVGSDSQAIPQKSHRAPPRLRKNSQRPQQKACNTPFASGEVSWPMLHRKRFLAGKYLRNQKKPCNGSVRLCDGASGQW